jgi:hypothetical protein
VKPSIKGSLLSSARGANPRDAWTLFMSIAVLILLLALNHFGLRFKESDWVADWLHQLLAVEALYLPAWKGAHHNHDALNVSASSRRKERAWHQ